MSPLFYFFVVLYTCIFCFGHYVMMGAGGRRKTRQAVKYVYVALKMLVAVAVSPLLVLVFVVSPTLFLPVFTFLWVHLDILGEDGSLYLRRWFMTPKTKWFRPRFLHLIARSDEGRDPHDRPNSFRTTILRGATTRRSITRRIRSSEPRTGCVTTDMHDLGTPSTTPSVIPTWSPLSPPPGAGSSDGMGAGAGAFGSCLRLTPTPIAGSTPKTTESRAQR